MVQGKKKTSLFEGDIELVGGFNHPEKYESQWEGSYPIYYGK